MVVDAKGTVTRNRYDEEHRLTEVIVGVVTTSRFEYYADGRQKKFLTLWDGWNV